MPQACQKLSTSETLCHVVPKVSHAKKGQHDGIGGRDGRGVTRDTIRFAKAELWQSMGTALTPLLKRVWGEHCKKPVRH